MTVPKLSLITPSFNQAQFLEGTILSVLDQSYPNLEYIVIDGGSEDGSLEIIRHYAKHLAYWESQRDRGQVDALNKGFALASGEIFGWVNSDDMLLPYALSRVGDYFGTPDVDIVYGQRRVIDKYGKHVRDVVIPDCHPLEFMIYGLGVVNQEATFWRADLHRAVGLLNEQYDQAFDYEFMIRLFERGQPRWKRAPEFLGAIRFHEAQKANLYDEHGRRVAYLASLRIRDAYLRAHHVPRPAFLARSLYYTTLRRLTMPRLPWPRTAPSASFWRKFIEVWH